MATARIEFVKNRGSQITGSINHSTMPFARGRRQVRIFGRKVLGRYSSVVHYPRVNMDFIFPDKPDPSYSLSFPSLAICRIKGHAEVAVSRDFHPVIVIREVDTKHLHALFHTSKF